MKDHFSRLLDRLAVSAKVVTSGSDAGRGQPLAAIKKRGHLNKQNRMYVAGNRCNVINSLAKRVAMNLVLAKSAHSLLTSADYERLI